jgi:glucosylceramidase
VGTVGASPLASSRFALVNRASGKTLDISGGSTADGAPAVLASDAAQDHQHWIPARQDDGSYRLSNVGSGKLIEDTGTPTTAGTQLQQATAGPPGQGSQQWTLTPTSDGYFTVANQASGLVVGVNGDSTADGAAVVSQQPTGSASQQWRFVAVPTPGAVYTLVNRNSGKTLGIYAGSGNDGALAVQWVDTNHPDQRWRLVDAGGGWYRLANAGSGKLLDDSNYSTSAGTQLQQWTAGPAGQRNQQWSLTPAGGGYLTITNQLSGLVVGVDGDALGDGPAIMQQEPSGSPSQQWQLMPR